jgi:hypothetical protein
MHLLEHIRFQDLDGLSPRGKAAFAARCARLAFNVLQDSHGHSEPLFSELCLRVIRLVEEAAARGVPPLELADARRAIEPLTDVSSQGPMRLRTRVALTVAAAAAAVVEGSAMQALVALTHAKEVGYTVGVHDIEEKLSRELPGLRSLGSAGSA